MKSDLFSYLPDINFAEKDPAAIESEIIGRYEAMTNRTLARGDPVRLLLNAVILAVIQQRNVIDIAAKNNLIAYASGGYLDHIGAMLGVHRLQASHALCTLRFTLSSEQNFNVIIPEGTGVRAGDGMTFRTKGEAVIKAGELFCDVTGASEAAGESGNGYIAGQINMLVDVFPYELRASNITETNGGSDIEPDENFRERIMIAPESFSSAGPANAYAYYARSAHNDIIDVAVIGPPDTEPGHVEIYPLMNGGILPDDEILEKVYETCNASDTRPDTDYVSVHRPVTVKYDLDVQFWIDVKNSGSVQYIQRNVESACDEWVKWQNVKLGRDINVSELTKRIITAGAKRCIINKPQYTQIKRHQVAVLNKKIITYAGTEEE